MEYRYKNIYLEETIEEIFCKLNDSNIEYDPLTFTLLYKPYENIEVYIYLIVGKILLIKIFDESFQIDNTLKVGIALTDEIINRYDLYYDDFEEVYLSKKYKELVVIVDLADNIIGFSFVRERGEEWDYPKDKIKNYLECKNLQDIYGSLYNNDTLDADIEKREIYGQLDNYKFTFDMITRDIKSIQNLETGEFIKIMKGVKDNELKKIEYSQHCILYYYALLTLIIFDFIAGVFFIINLIRFELLIFIIVFGIMIYFFTRAIVNCLKYYISKEECYCINENLIYKRILFKKFLLKELKIPLLDIEEVLDKGHVYSENGGGNYVSPTDFVFLFFKPYKRVLLNLKRGIKYDIFTYTYPYPYIEKEIYDDTDFLKSFNELKEMIEAEQKKILFNQKIENLSEKYNFPLDERYSYILNKILDEEKLYISEKDNNFIINGDSEAIKDLEIFKDMNFEEIDFYVFYVNYLSKKEYENKKVLVGYNGIDEKEVTMSKLKEDINELRDSRSRYVRKEKS